VDEGRSTTTSSTLRAVRAKGRAFDLLGTPAAVVKLFPRRAPVPRILPDVLDRMFSCGNEPARPGRRILRPDQPHLVARIDAAMPPDSDIRDDPTYRQIRAHRRIDHLSVVTASLPSDQSATADFSRAFCETRIRAVTTTRCPRESV